MARLPSTQPPGTRAEEVTGREKQDLSPDVNQTVQSLLPGDFQNKITLPETLDSDSLGHQPITHHV